MRISDWSSDVCSSDLARAIERAAWIEIGAGKPQRGRDIAEEVEKVGSVVGDDLVAAVKGAENRLERPPVIIETDILVEGVKFRAIDDRAEPQRRCVAIGLRLAVKPLVIAGNRDQLQPVAEFEARVENDATSPRRRGADRVLLEFVKPKTTTRLAIARGNQAARDRKSKRLNSSH